MSWLKWPLTPMSFGAAAIQNNRSNTPCVRDLESLLDAFKHWRDYYDKEAKQARERHAKLELIGDRDAYYEKSKRDNGERDVAKCSVAIKALEWAVTELKKAPAASERSLP